MGKTYRCPNCSGTEIVRDRGPGKLVCPKDRTSVDSYKAESSERAEQTKDHK